MLPPTSRHTFLFVIGALSLVYMYLSFSATLGQQTKRAGNKQEVQDLQQELLSAYDIDDKEFYKKKLAAKRSNSPIYSANFVSSRQNRSKLPLILGWTKFFNTPVTKMAETVMYYCPVQCEFSDDQSLAKKADVVLFHMHDIYPGSLPTVRYSFQRYVFWLVESAENFDVRDLSLNILFNWTITYRLDSDFINNYGELVIPNSTATGERVLSYEWNYVKNVALKKTKMVAQFVSHCTTPSRRENYVTELKKYINVDVFGACGEKECPASNDNCSNMLTNDYRFYLAFENSVCREYVTEKFWRLKELIVPIVLRGADYKNVAPRGSYIAADDFSSPQELAAFLIQLTDNKVEYLKYFEWTRHYWFLFDGGWRFFCQMCKAIHNGSYPSKTYENMGKWWNDEGDCQRDFALRLLQKSD